MKFPRNARIFRGQLDAAPFVGVFFCLVLFVLLAALVYTPGISMIQLPTASAELSGVDGPMVAVAMDPYGRLYFRNQWIQEKELLRRLQEEVKKSPKPLTMVIMADKAVTLDKWDSLVNLGRDAGITQFSQAVLPRLFDRPAGSKSP